MTTIQWTERTWNVVTGCDKVSEGCGLPRFPGDDTGGCYALAMAARLKAMGQAKYQRDGDPRTSGPGFGLMMHPTALGLPLTWRKPCKVFVNSMSDLFHPEVTDGFIAEVFGVMAAASQHTFQCLTKRPKRMQQILSSPEFSHAVARGHDAALVNLEHDQRERWAPVPHFDGYEASSHGRVRSTGNGVLKQSINPRSGRPTVTLWNSGAPMTVAVHRLVLTAFTTCPSPSHEACHRNGDKRDNRLANLRWGTRTENQLEKVRHGSRGGPQRLSADQVQAIRTERAAGRTQQSIADEFGVSRSLVSMIESGRVWAGPDLPWPLLNVHLGTSIELDKYAWRANHLRNTPAAVRFLSLEPLLGPLPSLDLDSIDWVIVGGESGPGAREMDLGWARDIRDRCETAGVAFFMKQLGAVVSRDNGMSDRAGHTFDEFPEDLRIREYPADREAAHTGEARDG